ncbi:NUDIX hydrolase [Pilimelia columellifera]
MPHSLAEKYDAYVASGALPAAPRVAATVLLLRAADAGFEVYALRRAATMAAFGGMYAFPGGSVDPADADAAVGWAGPPRAEWAGRLALPAPQAGAVVAAAVREVFEEAGVLLAGPTPDTVLADVDTPGWEAARQGLLARERSLTGVLTDAGLVLRSDLLRPWARWVTPKFEPRRFDTYFFVALLPEGQRPRDVSGEADETVWIAPDQAVARHERGEMPMLPPTLTTLTELAACPDLTAAWSASGRRDVSRPIEPVVERGSDGAAFAVF